MTPRRPQSVSRELQTLPGKREACEPRSHTLGENELLPCGARPLPSHDAGTQTLGSGVSSPQPATPPPFWQLTRHWAYVGLGQSRLPEAGRGLGATLMPRSRPGPTVCTKASLQAYDPP